jgi:PKD repeat protein
VKKSTFGIVSTCLAVLSLSTLRVEAEGEERAKRRDHPDGRAEWNAMLRRDAEGRLSAENRLRALRQACEMPVDASMAASPAGTFVRSDVGPSPPKASFGGTTWQSVGPMPMRSYDQYPPRQYGNVGGRVDSIAVHPTNSSILLLGAATGGIWKSTDGGQTWRPVSDYAPALAISHVAFSQANPSVVYAATGEADSGTSDSSLASSFGTYLGGGLLKSLDGGETWFRVDLNLPADAIISRVVPHPSDVQKVAVGIFRSPNYGTGGFSVGGIYRSTNGGVNFTNKYTHRIVDLVQDPNVPDRLFASTGFCNPCTSYGVFVSTDFGDTWQATSLSFAANHGNIKLGISRTNPAVLYASVLATDKTHTSTPDAGIYVSPDAGTTWQKKNVDPCMCPASGASCGDNGNNQCSYDHFITPDPQNPATVYFGSVSLYKSTDYGASWVRKADVYSTTSLVTIHPDQHTGVFDLSGSLLIGNDGGVYRSSNGAQTFQNLNATLNVSQFNSVALHPTSPLFAIGGTQDNGNLRFTGGVASWSDRTAGDGGFNLIRKDAPSQILSGYVNTGMNFSSDSGFYFDYFADCTDGKAPTSISCSEPVAFYPPAMAPPGEPGTVLFGTNRLWYNTTFGADPQKWLAVTSGVIASATDDYLTAIDAPTNVDGAIWTGSWQGNLWYAAPGAPFYSVGGSLPAAPITKIVAASTDGLTAFVTFAGYLGSPSSHVFRTTNGGTSWTNISSNLPDVPVLSMAVNPGDPNDLFVGTDVGVFRSVFGGAIWSSFNSGLPNVPVYDLKFHAVSNSLWAATYGRGIWRVAAGLSGSPPAANFSFSPADAAAGQAVQFSDASGGAPTAWSWDFGDGYTSLLQNPKHAFTGPWSYAVTLTVWSATGGSSAPTEKTVAIRAAPAGDFNGDGRASMAVFRPGTGLWYALSPGFTYTATQWGVAGDAPVPADYDGDGPTNVAVYRPGTGTWYVRFPDGSYATLTWGTSTDIPVPGDFDGDGYADPAVYRPSTGTWFVSRSSGGTTARTWGQSGDTPVSGDFDGDRKADYAVVRRAGGVLTWYILKSGGGFTSYDFVQWGVDGDIPAPADYDGDGKTDIAVFRPSTGWWYIRRSSDGGVTARQWGVSGDVPQPADYDGDAKADIAAYRPGNGTWYVLKSSDGGVIARTWGVAGDVPVTAPRY